MKPKLLATIIILIIAGVAIWFLPGSLLGNSALDINLHDTYIVVAPFGLYVSFIKLAAMLVLLARCLVGRFDSRVENCLLLVALFVVQQDCVTYIRFFSKLPFHGWTIYPPLSALPKLHPEQSSPLALAVPIFSFIQIILTLSLVICAIITGRNWNKANHETLL